MHLWALVKMVDFKNVLVKSNKGFGTCCENLYTQKNMDMI